MKTDNKKIINYSFVCNNGYTGNLIIKENKNELSIIKNDTEKEVFHTLSSTCKDFKDLEKQVKNFPEFLRVLNIEF